MGMIQAHSILSLVVVFLFCGSSYFLLKSVLWTVPYFNTTGFSKSALRMAKTYKIIAWTILTILFFSQLLSSFAEVWVQL